MTKSSSTSSRTWRIRGDLLPLCAVFLLLQGCGAQDAGPTDYEIELARIQREISELEKDAAASPSGIAAASEYLYLLYRRASLTGSFADLDVAQTAIDDTMERIGPSEDLWFLRANLRFKLHRLADAREDLARIAHLVDVPQIMALKADIDLQEGRYAEARAGYEDAVRAERTWDTLSRLAHLGFQTGDFAGAEELYVEAQDEITAKQMRHYAWVELQRGLLDFSRGRHEEAMAHYEHADRAYSGYWLIEEHIAELLGAQRKFKKAVALYEKVLGRAPRPEFQQALGDLHALMGEPELAKTWHEKALSAYLESARHGEVHYYHHLASFHADVAEDGAEAVRWARKDLELRRNPATHGALAWALYRDGQVSAALEEMRAALAPGVTDAHLFFQAATIYKAAGRDEEGEQLLKRAIGINPHVETVAALH